MTEHALLVDTSAGTIAAVVTLPAVAPRAGVVILEGSKGTRSGANQLWVRMARSLREDGIATLRADYAGMAESWDADIHDIVGGARELGCWFAGQVGEIVIVAECYGLTPAHSLCREDVDIVGIAVIAPPLYPDRALPTRGNRSLRRRLRLAMLRARSWRSTRRARKAQDADSATAIRGLVERAPTRIFAGDRDLCFPPLDALLPELQRLGTAELEVSHDLRLHRARTPEAQEAILGGVTAWVRQCVRSVQETV
jgi:hypothetical protein